MHLDTTPYTLDEVVGLFVGLVEQALEPRVNHASLPAHRRRRGPDTWLLHGLRPVVPVAASDAATTSACTAPSTCRPPVR